jgi:PadR family transcriptional regulator, regulatory protein AphA
MSLRHGLLGLLAQGPASGYDLLKIFELSLANVWAATQSQLYTELNRLAEAGLVTVVAEGPRGRKEYDISEEGREELRRWLTEVEPTVSPRSDMLLRVFFLGEVSQAEAKAYLLDRARVAAENFERLNGVRKIAEEGDDSLSLHGRLALEYGLRASAMQKEWAEWAAEQLRS